MHACPSIRRFLLVLLLLAPAGSARAQHAYVLSGGGARGIAHAGALVALEELGYDAPVVVGTSMGAIIGALYAAGYAPAQIRSIIADEQWLARFVAEPLAVGPQREARRPLVIFGLGARRFHEGLVPATGVNLRLVELLFDAGARARNDFDSLPRRYRAVATDLATGAEVVLGAGDLPRAVRASMAVPGAFAPVPWGDRMLIDGGVANNLPVAVARALSDLPVVAIDVVRPAPDAPERNALDIAVRALRLLIENAGRADGAAPELLVLPRIGTGLSDARFPADPTRLLDAGYHAAITQVPPLAVRLPPQQRAPRAAPLRVGAVQVEVDDASLRRLIEQVMRPAIGAYDDALIVRRTADLYDTGLFNALWPRLEFADGDDAAATLVVQVTPIARSSVAGSARWDNDVGGGVWASLRHRVSAFTPIELRAGGSLDELSHRAFLDAALFSVVLPGVLWNGGVHGSEERVRQFAGDSITGTAAVRRTGGWLGAERQGHWFVSALARADHVAAAQDGPRGWSAGPFLRVSRPREPDAVVGAEPLLELEARRGDVQYSRAHVRTGAAFALGDLRGAALVDVGGTSDGAPHDVWPAATRQLVPWLPAGALRSRYRAAAGLDVAWPIVLDGYVRARLRAVVTGDDVAGFDSLRGWRAGAELGAVWPTVIGLIDVGYARGAGGARLNASVGAAF